MTDNSPVPDMKNAVGRLRSSMQALTDIEFKLFCYNTEHETTNDTFNEDTYRTRELKILLKIANDIMLDELSEMKRDWK